MIEAFCMFGAEIGSTPLNRNNSLVDRGCSGGDDCPALWVTKDRATAVLSSDLPDEAFKALTSMSIAGPTGVLHLHVDAFARYKEEDSEVCSLLTVYAMPGTDVVSAATSKGLWSCCIRT